MSRLLFPFFSPHSSSSSSSSNTAYTPVSRQRQELGNQPREIRCPQTSHGIPSRGGREPGGAAAGIAAAGDIVQQAWVGVEGGVDEPDTAFTQVESGFVDQRQERADDGDGGGGAVDQGEGAIDSGDVVGSVRCDVGIAARGAAVVELSGGVRGRMSGEESVNGGCLVSGKGENVGEAAAGVDDGFTGLLWCGDGGAGGDLGSANGGHVGAGAGECWVEHAAGTVVVGTVRGEAVTAVAGDAEIPGRVEDGRALKTELHVLMTLAPFVEGSQVRFIKAIRCTDYFRCCEPCVMKQGQYWKVEAINSVDLH